MDHRDTNALIIGRGISGKGVAGVLAALGARTRIYSGANVPRGAEKYDTVYVSPGLPPTHPIFAFAASRGIRISSDIGLGAELNTAPVTAVTGTNGKTTVVNMLGEIYRAADVKVVVCGNVGRSFAECAYGGGYERAVLELSSFQLLHARPLKAHIACVLNITPDHLDYHGGMEAYVRAKLRIAEGQTRSDYLLVPAELDISGINGRPEVLREGNDFYADEYLTVLGRRVMPVSALAVKGEHNVVDALFAAAAAYADGIREDAIAYALSRFRTGAHRICEIGRCNGTRYYDDSKGTNPAATLAAAKCMRGRCALIAGGSDKGFDYVPLFRGLPDNVTAVFLTGGNAEKMAEAAALCGKAAEVCGTLRECVELCARGGYDSVLFSPASASFDRYADYRERGRAFEREVGRIIGS